MVNVFKRTTTSILKTLDPNSEVLEIITQDFHTMLRSREQNKEGIVSITCFAEEQPVTKLGKTFIVCQHPMVLYELSYLSLPIIGCAI